MRTLLLIPALLGGVALYATLDEDAGLTTWLETCRELAQAEGRIDAVRAEVERLRGEVAELESEPFALERAIREDLGFARPGETVVRAPAPRDATTRFP